jgi:prevent-host-death family protein
MTITTLSSRDFNQDTGRAKKAAERGPVFITDRGRRSHVLLSIQEYERLTRRKESLLDAIGMSGPEHDFDFDPPKLNLNLRPVGFGDDD